MKEVNKMFETTNYIPTAEERADFEKDMESRPFGEWNPSEEDLIEMERDFRSRHPEFFE